MSIVDQILRQRDLIVRMDQHYQKQLEFLHARIAKLEEQTAEGAIGPKPPFDGQVALPPLKSPGRCRQSRSDLPERLPSLRPQ
jgi:hypothetical protein